MAKKYKIVRYYRNGKKPRTIKRGLPLLDAKKHCINPKTKGKNWFDGFTAQ